MTKQLVERDADGFPHGWVLQRPSYGFHRSFYGTVGRPALVGEYTRFSRQVRHREAVQIADSAWQVTTNTGEAIVLLVRRSAGSQYVSPTLVLSPDWRPAPPEPPIPETVETAVAKTVEATTAPAAPAPGRRLSLGSTVAAMALEARLRRAGIVATS